jgi:hypothetical protein
MSCSSRDVGSRVGVWSGESCILPQQRQRAATTIAVVTGDRPATITTTTNNNGGDDPAQYYDISGMLLMPMVSRPETSPTPPAIIFTRTTATVTVPNYHRKPKFGVFVAKQLPLKENNEILSLNLVSLVLSIDHYGSQQSGTEQPLITPSHRRPILRAKRNKCGQCLKWKEDCCQWCCW